MESADTIHQESAALEHVWSPVCLSSASASTEYWSSNVTPMAPDPDPRPLLSLYQLNVTQPALYSRELFLTSEDWRMDHPLYPDDPTWRERTSDQGYTLPPQPQMNHSLPNEDDPTWREQIAWIVPFPLEGDHIRRRYRESTSQAFEDGIGGSSGDHDVREMTCGLKLDEHFWPIRHKIRCGELQPYEVRRVHSCLSSQTLTLVNRIPLRS
ncbi:hypothetical protein K438DRAFT_21244 [Mycena galopus ATCC 62051]|nr:hypothetical protein K438DRAFT_21244 [Mycena galopus ATCC 62051]